MYFTASGRELSLSAKSNNYSATGAQTSIRYGTEKNDVFYSAWGEKMAGGAGDDIYHLWQAGATPVENAGEGIDTVYSYYWGATTLTDNVENLFLMGQGSLSGTGNALSNIIVAGATGATLDGRGGDDVLVGGASADLFIVAKGNGSDAIMGFQAGWDTIKLSNYGFTSWSDLSTKMTQTGKDVTIALSGDETLVIRDIALSSLGATDFGFAYEVPTAARDSNQVNLSKVGNVHFANGWSALNNGWGSTNLVEGKDYWLSGVTNGQDVTSGTSFAWSYNSLTGPDQRVLAYPEIGFGISPFAPDANKGALLFPLKVSEIKNISADYDVSFGGTTSGFNVAFDVWFTSQPRGDASTITTELMIWVHSGAMKPFGTVVGTYAKDGFTAKIYHEGTYTALVADKDVPVGNLDLSDIIAKLTDLGIMSPNEYLTAIELGAEIGSGAGSFTVNNLDIKVDQLDAAGNTVTNLVTGSGVQTFTTVVAQPQHMVEAIAIAPPAPFQFDVAAGAVHPLSFNGGDLSDRLTIDYSKMTSGVTVDVTKTTGRIAGYSGQISYSSVENFTITGSSFNDTLNGGAGDDVLIGGAGNDVLRGGGGTNILNGGAGDDRYTIEGVNDVIIDESGNDFVTTTVDYTIHAGIETVSVGKAGLVVTGNAEANTIWGSSGVDTIYGEGGNDYIGAKDGNDLVRGGEGDDTIFGDGGNDTLYGDAGNDSLFGGDGDDRLFGGDGNDKLGGGAGNDYMEGGNGDDSYNVTDAGDVVVEGVDGGRDQVTATIDYVLTANVENLFLQGTNGLKGTGNALANVIWGDAGADTLYGCAGNDTLVGRGGADILSGGTGADIFRYLAVTDSTRTARDTIIDFNFSEGDRIDLSAIDARASTAANEAFTWLGTGAFTQKEGQLRYSVVGKDAIVEGDVNGDGIADLSILLKGGAPLSADYFML
ncbi:MAG: hypothetical protein ABW184_03010 [Sphingobium sp.]